MGIDHENYIEYREKGKKHVASRLSKVLLYICIVVLSILRVVPLTWTF